MNRKYFLFPFLLTISLFLFSCSPKSKYERTLKRELASGVRVDSLFMGLYLGMTDKDFYSHCWQLNRQGLIKQGSNNTTVQYITKNELRFPSTMDFYPVFHKGKIVEMPVKFTYTGWAPWNKDLSSDKLQEDVLKWYTEVYGGGFMEVRHKEKGSAFVQIKGNRRISIFKENEMSVWALFADMLVLKEIGNIPSDSAGKREDSNTSTDSLFHEGQSK